MPVNNTEPLSVYRAGPGYDNCLADLLLKASRGHRLRGVLDHLLDLPTARVLRVLALLSRHPAQHAGRIEHTLVALVDGVCAGTLTAREDPPDAYRPFSPVALAAAFERRGLPNDLALAALERQEDFLRLMPRAGWPFPAGTWRVEYLGVRPENRAGGVARGLLRRVEAEAALAGASALGLCCQTGNPRAVRLFAAMGFRETGRHRYPPELAHLGEGVLVLEKEVS